MIFHEQTSTIHGPTNEKRISRAFDGSVLLVRGLNEERKKESKNIPTCELIELWTYREGPLQLLPVFAQRPRFYY